MADPVPSFEEIPEPDISHLVIEDGEPVDNFYSERQQALLIDSLYASWMPDQPFVAMVNVGLFYALKRPPYVPDFLLTLGVSPPQDLSQKKNLTYLIWEYGKRPDLVVEVVSNINRHEERKLRGYADIGIPYYVIHDPHKHLSDRVLRAYRLHGSEYVELLQPWFDGLGLGLVLWQGRYRGTEDEWLRWRRADGSLLLTGVERAENSEGSTQAAEDRASQAEDRASQAEDRAREAEEKARELEERLRRHGLLDGQ